MVVTGGWLALVSWTLASPQVSFDLPAVVECRVTAAPATVPVTPKEKCVEVRLPISALMAADAASQLTELDYRLETPERQAQVIDFLPRTTMASEYAGNVGIEERLEQSSNVGVNATGSPGSLTAANATLATGDKNSHCRRYELLPPLETVAASGTLQRGSGVYFKLRPTTRSSLEGTQEVVVILRVPVAWRADYLIVHCQARGSSRQWEILPRETRVLGQARFLVALCLAGDDGARRVAAGYSDAEMRLRQASQAASSVVAKKATPTPVHELAAHLAIKAPRIPADWLEQLLLGNEAETNRFLGYLPETVRERALDYRAARRALRDINRPPSRLPEVAGG